LNEDAVRVDDRLVLVADGMGGHAAGEVASELAADTVIRQFALDPSARGLVGAVAEAHRIIGHDASEHPDREGMGTTLVALGVVDSENGPTPVVINVGDSRAYQLRDGALRQITLDHSVAEEWVRQGRLTPEEAAVHPRRHQLTRTLGVDADATPDVFPLNVEMGDRVLLCSDGLSNELNDDEIAALASAPAPLETAVSSLVELANRRGGRDNISVVVVEFTEPMAIPLSTGAIPAITALAAPEMVQPTRAKARPHRITWRVGIFLVAVMAVLLAGFETVNWYSRSSYYLAKDPAGYVGVYQGQPGGVLWDHPKEIFPTGVLYSALSSFYQGLVNSNVAVGSEQDGVTIAVNYLNNSKGSTNQTSTTTTSTTTTLKGH
jgi:protein phosphatase